MLVSAGNSIFQKSNRRIAALALVIFALDQVTKWFVLRELHTGDERIIIPGFFKFVHLENTGAAWSLFTGNNGALILVGLFALVALYLTRHHFDSHTLAGQIAFGLIFGGIAGNLMDRLRRPTSLTSSISTCNNAAAANLAFPPSTSPTPPSAPASA